MLLQSEPQPKFTRRHRGESLAQKVPGLQAHFGETGEGEGTPVITCADVEDAFAEELLEEASLRAVRRIAQRHDGASAGSGVEARGKDVLNEVGRCLSTGLSAHISAGEPPPDPSLPSDSPMSGGGARWGLQTEWLTALKHAAHIPRHRGDALATLEVGHNGSLTIVEHRDADRGGRHVTLINWKNPAPRIGQVVTLDESAVSSSLLQRCARILTSMAVWSSTR